jgi:hypothetical protein
MGLVFAAGLAGEAQAQSQTPIDPAKAAAAFAEAKVICGREGGKLWNHSLCGPILLVDPDTRIVIANQADPGGVLKPLGPAFTAQLFTGKLPDAVNIANTPTAWSGA